MKLCALFAFFLFSVGAAAGDDLSKHKQDFLEELDHHITVLQTAKSCVTAAQNQEGMKTCRENLEKAREQMHAQRREKHRENLDARIKQLEEEKAKLNKD